MEQYSIPADLVSKSFKACGLTLKLEHIEDNLINPRIYDHVVVEAKLRKLINKEEDVSSDRA